MKTTRFKDLPMDQQQKLRKILDRNRYTPKKRTPKIKPAFTKTELEKNFRNYLRYN